LIFDGGLIGWIGSLDWAIATPAEMPMATI